MFDACRNEKKIPWLKAVNRSSGIEVPFAGDNDINFIPIMWLLEVVTDRLVYFNRERTMIEKFDKQLT